MKQVYRLKKSIALLLSVLLLIMYQQPSQLAAAMSLPSTAFGQVLDMRQTELAPGAAYTWYDMKTDRGLEKAHFVEFDPKNPNLELQAGTKSGKVYGMQGVTQMAAYSDKPGNRVIAGINGDFYDLTGYSTGVPSGLFMDGGRILNSSVSSYAFGLKNDGTSIYGSPMLMKTITINGTTSNLTHINRYRENNQLVLYTTDYYTSTKTTDLGDEVILDILDGEVKSGQTMHLKVAQIRKDQGNAPLTSGQVVLSASGTARSILSQLQVNDVITAIFALDNAWQDVKVAIGGQGPLIKDGVVQTNVGPEGVHPRTAIGTKADGSIVMFEIDGRAPGFSEGVETVELGKILNDLGVINAMNLDGGGSSTFVAKLPGESSVKMLNQGSDGGERQTGNGLLLVNKAPEGDAAKFVVKPNMERVLVGASIPLKAAAVDANGHPAAFAGTPVWNADPSLGSIDENGKFTAGATAASGSISVTSGALSGTGEIEVVDKLTALQFPDVVKTFDSSAISALKVKALRNGQVIQANNSNFEWRVEGDIGTIDTNGVFTATAKNDQKGKIFVKFGDIETSMDVNVGIPPVVLEDFENGIDKYTATGATFNSVNVSLETNEDFVRFGNNSLKLSYDFVGKTGTSGAYLSFKNPTDPASRIQVPGYPEKISMWVYGDGKKHWLRGQMRDGNNAAFAIDYTDQTTGVNWTGWKYVEATVPKGKVTPLTMDLPVRYMETSNANKTAGAIYVDQIRAVYGPLDENRTPPILKNPYPAEDGTVNTATPDIRVIGEAANYDKLTHPGTTLIDPDKIRVYLDGALVNHGLYPPEGRITYKPATPLVDGVHKIKVSIRDMEGNQTINEWSFMVNTGAPKFVYATPADIYAGGTYTLDIKGEKVNKLKGGQVEFGFDPAIVENLKVIKGTKITDAQLQPVINEATGNVQMTFADLDQSALNDSDMIAQVQYTVKRDVIGLLMVDEALNDVSRLNTIEYKSGSIVKTDGAGSAYNGPAVKSTVKAQLQLNWNNSAIGVGYPASFIVTFKNGTAAEGAKLLIDGVEAGDAVTGANGWLTTLEATKSVKSYKIQAVKDGQYSPVMNLKVQALAGAAIPHNINVTMGDKPTVSRNFTWHTHPDTKETVVEIVKQSEFTDFNQSNVKKFNGDSFIYNTDSAGTLRVHKASAVDLEPDTAYVYRVGDGNGNYSAQGTFRTSPISGDVTKFLFIGDSQAADKAGYDLWGTTLQKALDFMPDPDFIAHAGDMVDKGYEEKEWNMFFGSAQVNLMKNTFVPVIGNHEVMGLYGNSDYVAHFNNPQNGLDGVKGSSFSYDIKDVHFVVLNSEGMYDEQKEWLSNDLKNTNKKWKVVFFHRGPYGSIYDTQIVRDKWTPIFDEYGVNLVMNGHDHVYLRSYPMKGDQKVASGEGTVYVVGGASGSKFYPLTEKPFQEVTFAEQTQIYTAVEINGNKMTVVAKTVDGREVDRFELTAKPQSVQLDRTNVSMKTGETAKLNASVMPSEANQNVSWSVVSSSPEGVVSVDQQGTVTALKPGTAIVRATSAIDSVFNETTVIVKKADDQGGNGNDNNQGGKDNPGDKDKPKPEDDQGRLVVKADDLKNVGGKVEIESKVSLNELILPGNAVELIGNAPITIKASNMNITIPPQVLQSLSGLVEAGEQSESSISLKASKVEADQADRLISTATQKSKANVSAAGDILNFTLHIVMKNGQTKQLSEFSEPITIALKAKPNTNKKLAGIYYISDSGDLEYIGGTWKDGFLTATVHHFSKYAILEFNKKYSDVPSAHWASDVISELSARHLIQGVSASSFDPNRNVSRAEFAAMLVRALVLKGEAASSFTDVPASKWYANEVALAVKVGIVNGINATEFAPEAPIKRQEMAAMIVRAYEYSLGIQVANSKKTGFIDIGSVPKWAETSIQSAVEARLMNGRTNSQFKPLESGTRAESAQLIYNLLSVKK
ncbi:phosphodiester glycosidase family protein [Cohnella soli]|uniref:Phosphodiester glycosidase family protein n=1 Tax=Cohnella soli TaxID=425005 RepID=A0ABW0HLR2_9BACL